MDGDADDNNLLGPLMVSYMAQMESALKVSNIVSKHNNEEELSADSVITGLIYRLMVPMEDKEMGESLNAK